MSRLRLIACCTATLLAVQPALAGGRKAERVPEPASVSLLVLGAVGLVVGRRLSRRR